MLRFLFYIFISLSRVPMAHADVSSSEVTLPAVRVLGTTPRSSPERGEFSGESIDVDQVFSPSVSSLLESTSSFVPQSMGTERNQTNFLVRGLDPIQNRVFIEGVSLAGVDYPQAYVGFLPIELVKNVDTYAEGIPVFLGEDGLGSAVNLRLKPLNDSTRTLLTGRMGSLSSTRAFGGLQTRTGIRWALALEYASAEEDFAYYDDGGTPFNTEDDGIAVREHNRYQRVFLFPRVELLKNKKSSLELFNATSFYQGELPGSVRAPLSGELRQVQSVSAGKLTHDFSSEWRGEALASVRFGSDRLSGARVAGFIPGDTETLGGKIQLGARYARELSSELVGSVSADRFTMDTKEKSRLSASLGASLSIPVWQRRLSIRPAVLVSYQGNDPGDLSTVENPLFNNAAKKEYLLVSPRLGLAATLARDWRARASVGSFARAPSLLEVYGTPSGLTPSPGLELERATKIDVGVDWARRDTHAFISEVRLSGTYFISRATNLISYAQSSPQTWTAINIGESLIHGQEIQGEVKTAPGLKGQISATLLWSENLSQESFQRGRELPGRASYRLLGGGGYQGETLNFGYQMAWSGPYFWDLTNSKRIESTVIHSAYVGLDLKDWGMLRLEGKNLFDETTATSYLGAWPVIDNNTGVYGYPAPGRRVYLSWSVSL